MKSRALFAALAASVIVAGCSSRPRPFAPQLGAVPADQRAFDLAQMRCADALVKGRLDRDGRMGSAGAAMGTGAAVAAVGGTAAGAAGFYGGLAVASATIVLLPFAVLGGAFGAARMKRTAKEKAVKRAMAGCLAEQGFSVTGWTRMSKAELATATARFEMLAAEAAANPTPKN
jgi:hypothetical protein